MNSRNNDEIIAKIHQEMKMADELSDMIVDVLMSWFEPTEYEVFRDNPICWRVREQRSAKTMIAVVLEERSEGTYAFTVGGDWSHRPTTQDTSKESLIEILLKIFPP